MTDKKEPAPKKKAAPKTEAKTEEAKTPLVKIDREKYQTATTAAGGKSLNNGDFVAVTIEGMTNDELYQIADKFLAFPVKVKKEKVEDAAGLEKAYADLNTGMQRMNLGNRFRSRITAIDAANEKAVEKAKKEETTIPKLVSGQDKLAKVAAPFMKARDARAKEAEAAKAKAAKEAKAEKAA